MSEGLTAEELAALGRLDTCTVANAIETFGRRLRNEGFMGAAVRCLTPQLPPAVGYAETLRIRSSSPPWERRFYFDRSDWWSTLRCVPEPRILVIEDIDPQVGVGAFVGGVHAHILRALGCVGAVTNGAVRDLPEVLEARLQLFGGNLSPSHAYVHVVEYGKPVTVAGLTVAPGDLLHADQHGVVRVPLDLARRIPVVAAGMRVHERRIRDFCRSRDFSLDGLRTLVEQVPRE
ncbi:MAG TPA: RraA family protein [Vicinamibacteria bacterium]|nr:RraA family protein [Vicinamibacteria bacterium]